MSALTVALIPRNGWVNARLWGVEHLCRGDRNKGACREAASSRYYGGQ